MRVLRVIPRISLANKKISKNCLIQLNNTYCSIYWNSSQDIGVINIIVVKRIRLSANATWWRIFMSYVTWLDNIAVHPRKIWPSETCQDYSGKSILEALEQVFLFSFFTYFTTFLINSRSIYITFNQL